MAIRDRLLDFEQRLKRLAGEPEPTEPIEVRQAIIQATVDLTQPAGRGRRVLPFDRVDVEVLAATAERRRLFEAVLHRDEPFDAVLRRALAAAGAEPGACAFMVHFRKKAMAGWSPRQHFAVRGHVGGVAAGQAPQPSVAPAVVTRGVAPAAAEAPSTSAATSFVLRTSKGRTSKRLVDVSGDRVNIGRGEDVTDRDRRLVRRNHVVFVDGAPLSDTVSRAHAHIRCSADGECRLRDDHSAYGTRIVRGGTTIDVLPTNTRGVRLQPGDDIHVGHAVLRFDVA